MSNVAFGIDLGTNNIKIYNRSDDTILVEKNMIAIENKNTLFAYGHLNWVVLVEVVKGDLNLGAQGA